MASTRFDGHYTKRVVYYCLEITGNAPENLLCVFVSIFCFPFTREDDVIVPHH